jgi:hypothetical protein
MKFLTYCSIVLAIVIVSNAVDQNTTSFSMVDGPYEEDFGSDEDIELDYYSDSDYDDWKPFPGKNCFIFHSFKFYLFHHAGIFCTCFMRQ